MPLYDFICDKCGHKEEVVASMTEISDLQVPCPKCVQMDHVALTPDGLDPQISGPLMRRVYTVTGVVFKGKDWPGQDLKRESDDNTIQRQRRKATVLKDRGDVPQEHVLGLKESDERFDKKYSENKLNKMYKEAGGITDE